MLVAEHGGEEGVRDYALLERCLERPKEVGRMELKKRRDHRERLERGDPTGHRDTTDLHELHYLGNPTESAERDVDVARLAAIYAIEIMRHRPLIAGNERLALAVFGTYLELWDYDVNSYRYDTIREFLKFAEGERSDAAFVQWVRDHIVKRKY